MKEIDLEKFIYELSQTKQGRESLLYDYKLKCIGEVPLNRQVRLGEFGVVDLIGIDDDVVEVYELKKDPIQLKDIVQCCRYYQALKKVKKQSGGLYWDLFIKINLIVSYSNIANKDIYFLISQLPFLSVTEYKLTPNGIEFNPYFEEFPISEQKVFNGFDFIKDNMRIEV